jgi:hypothetical protein
MAKDVSAFIFAMCRHWTWWIGGTFIAAALAVYQETGGLMPIWFIWAWVLAGIVVAAFLVWRDQRALAQDALEKLRPKLKIACSRDIDGCVKPALWPDGPVNFFRIMVEGDCVDAVNDCKGQLTSIKHDAEIKWSGDQALLTFAPGEDNDATSKTIRHKVAEYLDILAITYTGVIRPGTRNRGWPYIPPLGQIFEEIGEYIFTVKISGQSIPTVEAILKFDWTGDYETSALSLISDR